MAPSNNIRVSFFSFVCLFLASAYATDDVASPSTIRLHRLVNDPMIDEVDRIKELLLSEDPTLNLNHRHPTSGQTALMASSLNGRVKIAELLLNSGADPEISEKDGKSPQQYSSVRIHFQPHHWPSP